jgi:hypothetical protein
MIYWIVWFSMYFVMPLKHHLPFIFLLYQKQKIALYRRGPAWRFARFPISSCLPLHYRY